mmetsp:Transcript_31475/g.105975  ORF Transcript_31475/g.105975 Transcript_31475/m.105975 type:complete len:270 (+) Transcript_31475:67-876(+)
MREDFPIRNEDPTTKGMASSGFKRRITAFSPAAAGAARPEPCADPRSIMCQQLSCPGLPWMRTTCCRETDACSKTMWHSSGCRPNTKQSFFARSRVWTTLPSLRATSSAFERPPIQEGTTYLPSFVPGGVAAAGALLLVSASLASCAAFRAAPSLTFSASKSFSVNLTSRIDRSTWASNAEVASDFVFECSCMCSRARCDSHVIKVSPSCPSSASTSATLTSDAARNDAIPTVRGPEGCRKPPAAVPEARLCPRPPRNSLRRKLAEPAA